MAVTKTDVASQDADSQKFDMFEDLNPPANDELPADEGKVADNEDPAIDEGWEPAKDPTNDEYAAALAAAGNDTPEWTPEEPAPTDTADPASTPDEIQAFLDELDNATGDSAAADKKLDDAIETGDVEEIRKARDESIAAWLEKDRIIKSLMHQLEIERQNSDKILDDKFTMESDFREKWKIAEVVMNDDSLKSLIAYKSKAESNPEFKAKYVDVLKSMFEAETGISLDDLIATSRKAEKSMMAWNDFSFEGNAPKSGALGWMLEDIG